MFDISWSELLILAVVTLLFVGPKELPVFLRTIGRYAGSVKRQAAEFRAHFDAAMREAELDAMRKDVEEMQRSINEEVMRGTAMVDAAGEQNFAEPRSDNAAKGGTSARPDMTTPPPVARAAGQPPRPATPRNTPSATER